jgi:hypothetical protein
MARYCEYAIADAGGLHRCDVQALNLELRRELHLSRDLSDLIRGLLSEGAEAGDVRDDVAPAELASFCLFALAAASSLPSEAAVSRLVGVTLAGLRLAH